MYRFYLFNEDTGRPVVPWSGTRSWAESSFETQDGATPLGVQQAVKEAALPAGTYRAVVICGFTERLQRQEPVVRMFKVDVTQPPPTETIITVS